MQENHIKDNSITGKIIKGIAGFYYVQTLDRGLYECKAKGVFRKEKIKPLVGDNVVISIVDEAEKKGNIDDIYPRKNELIRPVVANIDQVLVIFAASQPKPNLNLLDRFLVAMETQGVPAIICFNKIDTVSIDEQKRLAGIYEKSGAQVLLVSAKEAYGLQQIRELLEHKTTAVAGPSGVGKSSLVNLIVPEARMETGEISLRIDRGKHTTRHSEILPIGEDSFICDTPGFTALAVWEMEKEELKEYFAEFVPYEGNCRFLGCTHTHEPQCAVKEAMKAGEFSKDRYQNYLEMFEELKNRRKY